MQTSINVYYKIYVTIFSEFKTYLAGRGGSTNNYLNHYPQFGFVMISSRMLHARIACMIP
jgi:hypothetical protein